MYDKKMALTNRNKNAIRNKLLNQMGVTGYEKWLQNQGQPPKGDGPKIYKLASELYGPPLTRVSLSEVERDKRFRALQKLGVNPELVIPMLSGIVFARANNKKSGRVKSPVAVNVSNLRLTLFNATVLNKDRDVDLMSIVQSIKLPFKKKRYSNGYTVEVVEVKARHGKFQTAFEISDEYIFKSKKNNVNINALEFKVRLSKDGQVQGASFTIYNNGSIRFSGGYIDVSMKQSNAQVPITILEQPETIRHHIINTYAKDSAFLKTAPLKFNNIGAVFTVSRPILLEQTASLPEFARITTYEPEMSPRMVIRFPDFALQASTGGIIQIKGIRDPDLLGQAYNEAVRAVRTFVFKKSDIKNFNKRAFKKATISKRSNALPAPNVSRRGTTCPVGRRPDPYSFQGACPDIKFGKKTVSGANCYVRPNPQGQPCCYKKPKKIAFSKNKVEEAYAKANVKVPNAVRTKFNIGANTNNKKNNVGGNTNTGNINIKNDPVTGIKIGTRQCSRYTRVALFDIAKRLGIMGITGKTTKEALCAIIRTQATNRTRESFGNLAVKFKNQETGKEYSITGDGAKMKIGNRFAITYDKTMLVRFCEILRIADVSINMSKPAICKMINDHVKIKRAEKRNRAANANAALIEGRARRANAARARAANEQKAKNNRVRQLQVEKNEALNERLGFTAPIIEKELPKLFGPKFMRVYGSKVKKDFPNMARLMIQLLGARKFNTGKRGNPTKPSVDQAKREIVADWKRVIEPALVRSAVFATMNNVRTNLRKLVGPNAKITNSMLVSYAKSVRNAAGTRNNKTGKFASEAQIQKARNVWLYAERTYGSLKPKTPPRAKPRSANVEEI